MAARAAGIAVGERGSFGVQLQNLACDVVDLCEFFMAHGSPRAACVIASSASGGPHPTPLRRAFHQLAQAAALAMQADALPSLGCSGHRGYECGVAAQHLRAVSAKP
jgi:hypothetical protein